MMSKIRLGLVITFGMALAASVSAQVKGGAGQPRELAKELVVAGTANASRARIHGASQPLEPKLEANHSSTRNGSSVSAGAVSNNLPDANRTRLRTATVPAVTLAASSLSLSQIYRVGVGDVLDVQLPELPTGKSTLFTVLEGGLLDYPLSSAPVAVAGLTADEVAAQLRSRIKVLENPKVVVKIRDYASHNIIITGLVSDPGAKFLRREATPLYVVLAEARPRPEALTATILRNGKPALNLDLKDQNSLGTLVMPGDTVKVFGPQAEAAGYFYSGGALKAPGQKAFHNGLTLTQAILASGGVTASASNKVKVSRQGTDGRLTSTEFNLRQIEEGKTPDPVLQRGDRISVSEQR
jgi:protein involved in polysaccharide export with SLBB domain